MKQSYIYDPPPPPPPKATTFLTPLKTYQPLQYVKKRSFQTEKIQKINYKHKTNRIKFIPFSSNFHLKNIKKNELNKVEEYSKHTYSTLLEDGTIDYKTVFYNKDGYAMSSTANIYITNNNNSIENKPKNENTCTETPEEIAAWIAERKKKWPTDKNIQEKEEERLKRLDKVKNFLTDQIKSDFLGNNHDSNLLSNSNSSENTNKVENIKDLETLLKDSDSCKYFLEKKCNHENDYTFNCDNNRSTKEHKKRLSNLGKNNIWRVRKSLYTKLVEKEELEENMIILQAIKHLVEFYNIE
ncbi:hypothetical protein PCANB_000083 [Pneumocystis canis]|nr:hypothetical protein PCANB_000083 [Pneumocystis canis]